MSERDRPIDLLLASLLAANPAERERAEAALGKVAPEELERLRKAQAATLSSKPQAASRLDRFVGQLARFFDFTEADAQKLLARVEPPEEWMEGPDVGISIMPVQTGPRAQTALASLVRLPPGVTLSHHEHIGLEQLLVLDGGLSDSEGNVVWPGETLEMSAGTSHSMWGLPGPACVCAALLWMDSADGAG